MQINEILTKNTEEDIEHLQQIKCELEAWEEMKEYIYLGHADSKEGIIDYVQIDEMIIYETNIYDKVKKAKALEVEDEYIN